MTVKNLTTIVPPPAPDAVSDLQLETNLPERIPQLKNQAMSVLTTQELSAAAPLTVAAELITAAGKSSAVHRYFKYLTNWLILLFSKVSKRHVI